MLGSYELSPRTSEVIDNTLFALLLGVPIFLKKQVQENAIITINKKEEELNHAYQLRIQSELEALQSKVNPHFLYNSLNSIACLIYEDPAKAERMVLLLSDLFRYTLNNKSGNFSTIEEELKMVKAYLEIELIRFQDNLTCEIDVKDELSSLLIPRFLLQPLVENAIKHGTSKREKGNIKLKIFNVASDLCISVADNGPSFPEEYDSGYGLKGILDKLNLLYKDDFEFSLNNEPTKEVKIILKNTITNE
ncbi:MAG: histidine kinase [Flavobacteriales bacterium]|nr:histidine kinase [Flavobacteriales bacterium]